MYFNFMILLTGASGLLGQYLKIQAFRPTHEYLDITKTIELEKEVELIIHCAAYTNVQQAETNKKECFDVNVNGTMNLLLAYPDVPIVYISSEYAHNPVNFYSFTKNLGEQLCMNRGNCLIIRTLFKATPWPFEKAFKDQFTEGDYVDVIAPLIDKAIMNWGRKGKQIVYVGTGRKTIYELAKRTKPDVIPNSIKDMAVPIPADYL